MPEHAAPVRRWVVVDLLLLALGLALATALALVLLTDRDDPAVAQAPSTSASALQVEVSEAASAQATAFLAVDHREMDAVVDRVLAGATGRFAEEYAAERRELLRTVRAAGTVAVAEARAVGVTVLAHDRAVVLVAADTQVSDRGERQAQELRRHRLRLELVRADGRWLTERLEFVR